MDLTTGEEWEVKTSTQEEKSAEEYKESFGQEGLPVLGSAVISSTTGGSLALSLAGDSSLAGGSSLTGERSLAEESALGGLVEADDESEEITTPS